MKFLNPGSVKTIFVSFITLIFVVHGEAQIWEGRSAMFPFSNTGKSVYAITDSIAWTLGVEIDATSTETLERNAISRTRDNGLTWSNVNLPLDTPSVVSSIYAFDYNRALISYVEFPDGPEGQQGDNVVMYTDDGGLNWTPVSVPVNTFINFIYMWNAQEGIVVGDPDSEGFEIYRTVDGGLSWERILTGFATGSSEYLYTDNYAVRGDQLWFASNRGKIFHTTSKGSSWVMYDSPSSLAGIGSMNVNDQGDVFMFYNTFGVNGFLNTIFRRDVTTGQWENISEKTSTYMYDIYPVPASEAILITFYTGPNWRTQISYDRGDTWLTINTGDRATHLSFYNPGTGYATQYNPLSDTTNTLIFRYAGNPLTGLIKNTPLLNVDIQITPNPTTDVARITLQAPYIADYWIFLNDISGNLIMKESFRQVSEIHHQMDIKHLPSGLYLLTVANEQGMRTEKLVRL